MSAIYNNAECWHLAGPIAFTAVLFACAALELQAAQTASPQAGS